MNNARKRCIIPTPIHIGDAMFIGVGISENGDSGKKPVISSVSGDSTVPNGENDKANW